MSKIPDRLITYCTNIHPAQTWDETFAALRKHIPAIKSAVSPAAAFPIGLRLSSLAASELTAEKNRDFKAWLAEEDCFILTINGFPYGAFHGDRIKEQVYLPDWRSHRRAAYTIRLASLLATWLPEGMIGTISTVPLGFKELVGPNPYPEIRRELEFVLTRLARFYNELGKQMVLAVEPEPGCLLETTEEVCRFFDTVELHPNLRKHLGICYDCCHQAVQFEDPATSLSLLDAAEIPLAKVQVSSALRVRGDRFSLLAPFDEPCYLHQVVLRRRNGVLVRYRDLPDALARHISHEEDDEWRCHFHVPIFLERSGGLETTGKFLADLLPLVPKDVPLEVETYTSELLPASLAGGSVTESIIREMKWLKERLHA